jgi:hypothetical protein
LIASGGDTLNPEEQQVAALAEAKGKDPFVAAAWYRMGRQFRTSPVVFVSARGLVAWWAVTQPWIAPLDVFQEENFHYDVARVDWGEPFPKQPSSGLLGARAFIVLYQFLILASAVLSVAFMRRSPRLLLVATFPLYVVAVHTLTLFISRYFLPAMPSLIVLAAAGLYGLWHAARHRLGSTG